jgi:hypothetical protein
MSRAPSIRVKMVLLYREVHLVLHVRQSRRQSTSRVDITKENVGKGMSGFQSRQKHRQNRTHVLGPWHESRSRVKRNYGWIPHNASFDFLDIARPTLGQICF